MSDGYCQCHAVLFQSPLFFFFLTLDINNFTCSCMLSLQIAIMSVTLVPIRLLGLSLSLVIAWIFASIALFGRTKEDEKKPMSGWRR